MQLFLAVGLVCCCGWLCGGRGLVRGGGFGILSLVSYGFVEWYRQS
jgi:hypothetical protein